MMSATARDIPGANLDETIAHEPNPQSGPDRPMGSSEMPTHIPTPQGHRYTYGSGARPLDGYTIKRAIGRGGFGEVYYATSDAGKEVALKLILRNLEVELRGVVQCMNLKCPNLLAIYDLKSNDAGESFVIMEYVAGPSLANVLAKHPRRPAAWPRSAPGSRGSSRGSPTCTTTASSTATSSPPTSSWKRGSSRSATTACPSSSPPARSPSTPRASARATTWPPRSPSGKYDKPIDIYALGIILYEMLTGRVPFEGETVGEVLMKHLTSRPDVSGLPAPYQSIVARALAKDPNSAPGARLPPPPPGGRAQAPSVRFIGEGKVTPPLPPDPKPAGPAPARGGLPDRGRGAGLLHRARDAPPAAAPDVAPARPPDPGRGPSPPRRARPAMPTPMPAPPPRRAGRAAPPARRPGPGRRAGHVDAPGRRPGRALLGAGQRPARRRLRTPAAAGLPLRPDAAGDLGHAPLLQAPGRAIVRSTSRRVVFLLVGLALGGVGAALAWWTRLDLDPAWHLWVVDDALDLSRWVGSPGHPNPLAYAIYFGLAFFAIDWWKLSARDRKARFRVIPVVKTGLIGLLLGLLWPFPQPWGLGVIVLIAVIVQLVSPWSEAAAAYARDKKQKRRLA